MSSYPELADPVRVRRWEEHVADDADLAAILDEATGHSDALRDALYAGVEPVSVTQDRALLLMSVINRLRSVAG
jgi:hypothetical protein